MKLKTAETGKKMLSNNVIPTQNFELQLNEQAISVQAPCLLKKEDIPKKLIVFASPLDPATVTFDSQNTIASPLDLETSKRDHQNHVPVIHDKLSITNHMPEAAQPTHHLPTLMVSGGCMSNYSNQKQMKLSVCLSTIRCLLLFLFTKSGAAI